MSASLWVLVSCIWEHGHRCCQCGSNLAHVSRNSSQSVQAALQHVQHMLHQSTMMMLSIELQNPTLWQDGLAGAQYAALSILQ